MYVIEDNRLITLLILLGICYIIFVIIRSFFRLIKWILTSIWYLLTGRNRRPRNDPRYSSDWLSRAQARQEIRFQNALPPLAGEAQPLKKTRKERRNERKGLSPTGWKFNEETQMWEPPKK